MERCPYCFKILPKNGICSCRYEESENARIEDALKPGTIVGACYQIGGVLGKGGFGITYKGYDLNLEKEVAIKEFFPEGLVTRAVRLNENDPLRRMNASRVLPLNTKSSETYQKSLDLFYREAKALARLSKLSNVVHVYHCFPENDTAYIVMDYVNGESLLTILGEKGRFSESELIPLLDPVLDALQKVHAAGILHRDIAPDNIVLNDEGQAVLLDFGAARVDPGSGSSLVIGKKGYSPVEQMGGGPQDVRSDIYALGATYYHLLTGKIPQESYMRALDDRVDPLNELIPNISPQTDHAVMKAMAVKPELRWKNVSDFKAALHGKHTSRSAYPTSFITESRPGPHTEARLRKTRKKDNRLWILPIIVVLLGAVVFSALKYPGWLLPAAVTETNTPAVTAGSIETETPQVDAALTQAALSAAIETMDALQTGESFASETEKTQEAEFQIMTAAAQIMIAGAESATQEAEVRMTETVIFSMTREAEELERTAAAQKATEAAEIRGTESAVRETHEALAATQSVLETAFAFATREAETMMTGTAAVQMTRDAQLTQTARAAAEARAMGTASVWQTETARPTETETPTAAPSATVTPSPTMTPEPTNTPTVTRTPTATETAVPTLPPVILPGKFVVGDEFTFGSYEQDADPDTGPEPVMWQILEIRDKQVLLISKYALDAVPFSSDPRSVWDTSRLKEWLNNDFYNAAFTESEKQYIGSSAAGDLFVLSADELPEYFPRIGSRVGVSTPYAKEKAHRQYDNQIWWLRTTLEDPAGSAGYVDENGEIRYTADKSISYVVVRPCFRLDLGSGLK